MIAWWNTGLDLGLWGPPTPLPETNMIGYWTFAIKCQTIINRYPVL